jgi:selenocysteine lyase/cysteine desulfurase
MRGFLLPGVDLEVLRRRLLDANVRAWTGAHDASASLVRVATGVYNDQRDIDELVRAVEPLVTPHRSTH